MKSCLHCKSFFDSTDEKEIENNKCPECGYELFESSNAPEDIVKKTMEIEISSRGEWIQKMNTILGYDNSDGFHSEPCPHDIARELRRFVQDFHTEHFTVGSERLRYFQLRAEELIEGLRTPRPTNSQK